MILKENKLLEPDAFQTINFAKNYRPVTALKYDLECMFLNYVKLQLILTVLTNKTVLENIIQSLF